MLEVTLDVYFKFCLLVYRTLLKPGFVFLCTKMTNLANSKSLQTIEFPLNGGEKTAAVIAENVIIIPSPGDHKNGSSKVKLTNVVDYSWEDKYYTGQLVAVHMGGKYLAYSITGTTCFVRVVNRENAKRALIKGFGGMIEDVAFAFIPTQYTIACVDETGAVFIYNIFEDAKDIAASLLLHILQVGDVSLPRRVFWCPFIPEDMEDDPYGDDTALLLAVIRDNKVEVWNVAAASSSGPGPVQSDKLPGCCIQIAAHEKAIVAAAFSPDGTAIATASIDGECKFFQVYLQSESEPTCLHHWKPHGGKPVTSLFFLDDHKCGNPEIKFWKYAVTGTDDNNELKLWTCETWKCLQTIRFSSKGNKKHYRLRTSVDLSSGYLFVSDMYRKILFILELDKGNEDVIPYIRSATEFTFPCPILSFAVAEAGPQPLKNNSLFSAEDLTNGEDDECQIGTQVRMYLVQPKSLQECHIVFQTSNAVTQTNSISYEKNGLDEEPGVLVDSIPPQPQPQLNLMTPDAFNSPHTADSTPILSRNSATPAADISMPYPGNLVITNGEQPNDAGGGERRRGFISGGSSPSREVEEILSSPRYYPTETDSSAPKPHPQPQNSVNLEMKEQLKSLGASIKSLHSDVQELISSFKNYEEDAKKNRGTSLSDLESVITNAVSTYKPVSEQDIVSAIAPLITQSVLSVVNPAIIKSMADLQAVVHSEVASKLTCTDNVLKDNISKLVKSKAFTDQLTRSFSSALSAAVEPVFRESFTRVVIPMFEAACQQMFTQMSDSFTKGINETIKAFDDQAKVEMTNLHTAVEQINQSTQQLSSTVEKETRGLEEVIVDVERRMKVCVNGAVVRSGTVTPAHSFDPHVLQSQIIHLIKQGHYNTAFQQALSASDLTIVTFICEKVDPSKLFTRCGCILQQHVLLSLIQQLAADMTSQTETKLRYLEGAVMSLLPDNENTREHMPQVLSGLHKQLLTFTASSSEPSLVNKARLLAMACQHIVRDVKDERE